LEDELLEVTVEGLAVGNLEVRKDVAFEGELDVAPICDLEGGLARARPPGKLRSHLFWGL
jgi:hypothetical protein